MGAETKIAWCDRTFQPWIGCQRVSPGCQHCYAEAQDQRWRPGATRWGPTAPRTRTSASYWRQPLAWNRAAEAGTRARVFCASLADVFEARLELIEWRTQLLDLIARTPHLDWLLLTKRPENIPALLRQSLMLLEGTTAGTFTDAAIMLRLWLDGVGTDDGKPHPPGNVWLGTTVEDQRRANERIPALLSVPARVRFLSCEPLLERVDLARPGLLWRSCSRCGGSASLPVPGGGKPCHYCLNHQGEEPAGIDWIIIGGESGPQARPFDVAWARSLVGQGRQAGAAVFVKQLGSAFSDHVNGVAGRSLRVPDDAVALISRRLVARAGEDPAEWPEDLRVREFPTTSAASPRT